MNCLCNFIFMKYLYFCVICLQQISLVEACYIFNLACNVLIQPKLLEHCMLTIRGVSTIYHTLYLSNEGRAALSA